MKLLLKGTVLLLLRQSSNGHLCLLINVDVSCFTYFPARHWYYTLCIWLYVIIRSECFKVCDIHM
jgi:hypothetical protein